MFVRRFNYSFILIDIVKQDNIFTFSWTPTFSQENRHCDDMAVLRLNYFFGTLFKRVFRHDKRWPILALDPRVDEAIFQPLATCIINMSVTDASTKRLPVEIYSYTAVCNFCKSLELKISLSFFFLSETPSYFK